MSGDVLPDFVTPIPLVGETVPAIELPPDIREKLAAQLEEIDRCRAQAMIDAHRVIIR